MGVNKADSNGCPKFLKIFFTGHIQMCGMKRFGQTQSSNQLSFCVNGQLHSLNLFDSFQRSIMAILLRSSKKLAILVHDLTQVFCSRMETSNCWTWAALLGVVVPLRSPSPRFYSSLFPPVMPSSNIRSGFPVMPSSNIRSCSSPRCQWKIWIPGKWLMMVRFWLLITGYIYIIMVQLENKLIWVFLKS